jgi:ABC-type protease/lipase transport system fused ATPase/permease subunit
MAQILMLAAGAYLVLDGEATTGLMIAGSILLNLALSPIDQAVATWRGVVSLRDAQGRLRLQLAVSDERTRRGRAALSEPRGELSVERAMHIPQGRSRPVIKPVSFGLAAGQMLGIIGPAAAGKSVLARMLVGLVPPQAGTVQLDGVDLHEWLAAGLGRHIGYLPQSPAFFAGTIADNIARLDVDTPERNAAVRQAAEAVQAHGFILNLPQGYETDLDSVVPFLSQSELQKLALARAFYGMPRLVVLDEPAASLDRSGEAALVEVLAAFKERGSTLVVVSQRPALMRMCDKLILLRDGVMQAFGEPEKVLKQLRDAEEDAGKRLRMLHIANG